MRAYLPRHLFHEGRALERLHGAPRLVGLVRRLDRGVDVGGVGLRALAKARAGRRVERLLVAARRLMPLAAVIEVAVPGQDRRDAGVGADGFLGLIHGRSPAVFRAECIIRRCASAGSMTTDWGWSKATRSAT